MSESPHLGIGYLAPSQAQKHVTVNEAFRRLDALVQLGVKDRDRVSAPAGPSEGDRHIVAVGATGDWAGQDGKIAARLDGLWVFVQPKPGWIAFDAQAGALVVFRDGAWVGAASAFASLDDIDRLGIATTADAVNRLAVASEAALFTHAGAGVQVKLNKAGAGDTASLLFQTGYSGRAECGLAGSDGFALKVSVDGGLWSTALSADPATGAVDLPNTPTVQVDKFIVSGTWTKPPWARRVRVIMVAGGSGGGSGGVRAAGVAVAGGGGGAPGGVSECEMLAADLGPTVAVTVGAGGDGGGAQATAGADGLAGSLGGHSAFGSHARSRAAPTVASGGGAASGAGGIIRGVTQQPPSPDILGGAGSTAAGAAGANGPGRTSAGGGGGGGLTAANVAAAGGQSGQSGWGAAVPNLASGGVAPGGAGNAGTAFALSEHLCSGGAGGGGAASASANGGVGGDGAAPGGAGGGGGAARAGFSSGKGGDGARGEVWVVSLR